MKTLFKIILWIILIFILSIIVSWIVMSDLWSIFIIIVCTITIYNLLSNK